MEMEKWSRNGSSNETGIGMCMMFSQCNTYSMVLYNHCSISILCANYVVKKGHEQVEKTWEMKKWSRNGKLIKQGRNVYDVLAM